MIQNSKNKTMNQYALRIYINTIFFGKMYHNISLSADNEPQAIEKAKEINPNAVVETCQLIKQ